MSYQEPTTTVTAVTYTPSPALDPWIRGLHFLSNKAMDSDEMRPTINPKRLIMSLAIFKPPSWAPSLYNEVRFLHASLAHRRCTRIM
jgi:hypothetical protein